MSSAALRRRMITADDLAGLPGLRRDAAAALLSVQPTTVREALAIPDVGRKTTNALLRKGLLTDTEGVQTRSRDSAGRRRVVDDTQQR